MFYVPMYSLINEKIKSLFDELHQTAIFLFRIRISITRLKINQKVPISLKSNPLNQRKALKIKK
jgi:hypothetical protein